MYFLPSYVVMLKDERNETKSSLQTTSSQENENIPEEFDQIPVITIPPLRPEVDPAQSVGSVNETNNKNDSHESRITESTVVKIENPNEEQFDSFIVDYENDIKPFTQTVTSRDSINKSSEVQSDVKPWKQLENPNEEQFDSFIDDYENDIKPFTQAVTSRDSINKSSEVQSDVKPWKQPFTSSGSINKFSEEHKDLEPRKQAVASSGSINKSSEEHKDLEPRKQAVASIVSINKSFEIQSNSEEFLKMADVQTSLMVNESAEMLDSTCTGGRETNKSPGYNASSASALKIQSDESELYQVVGQSERISDTTRKPTMVLQNSSGNYAQNSKISLISVCKADGKADHISTVMPDRTRKPPTVIQNSSGNCAQNDNLISRIRVCNPDGKTDHPIARMPEMTRKPPTVFQNSSGNCAQNDNLISRIRVSKPDGKADHPNPRIPDRTRKPITVLQNSSGNCVKNGNLVSLIRVCKPDGETEHPNAIIPEMTRKPPTVVQNSSGNCAQNDNLISQIRVCKPDGETEHPNARMLEMTRKPPTVVQNSSGNCAQNDNLISRIRVSKPDGNADHPNPRIPDRTRKPPTVVQNSSGNCAQNDNLISQIRVCKADGKTDHPNARMPEMITKPPTVVQNSSGNCAQNDNLISQIRVCKPDGKTDHPNARMPEMTRKPATVFQNSSGNCAQNDNLISRIRVSKPDGNADHPNPRIPDRTRKPITVLQNSSGNFVKNGNLVSLIRVCKPDGETERPSAIIPEMTRKPPTVFQNSSGNCAQNDNLISQIRVCKPDGKVGHSNPRMPEMTRKTTSGLQNSSGSCAQNGNLRSLIRIPVFRPDGKTDHPNARMPETTRNPPTVLQNSSRKSALNDNLIRIPVFKPDGKADHLIARMPEITTNPTAILLVIHSSGNCAQNRKAGLSIVSEAESKTCSETKKSLSYMCNESSAVKKKTNENVKTKTKSNTTRKTTIMTQHSSGNCATIGKRSLNDVCEQDGKADHLIAALSEPATVNIGEKEDGTFTDSFILNDKLEKGSCKEGTNKQLQSYNVDTNFNSEETCNITGVQKYRNENSVRSKEVRVQNKRLSSNSVVVPECCKNDPKLGAYVVVKLRRLEKSTLDVSGRACNNFVTKLNAASDCTQGNVQVKTKQIETDEEKFEQVEESFGKEPGAVTEVESEPNENGDLTSGHSDSLTPDIIETEEDQTETIIFAGNGTNYGFLKLFPELELADKLQNAGTLIIPTDENFITSRKAFDVFRALIRRKKMLVSSKWVTESVMMGTLQDKKKFLVKGIEGLGKWSLTEDYHNFKYKIGFGTFTDISKDDICRLLNAIGGEEQVFRKQDTVYVCADDEFFWSDHCVPKEWIFKCIIDGRVLSTDRAVLSSHLLNRRSRIQEPNVVSEEPNVASEEPKVVSDGDTEQGIDSSKMPKITIQSSVTKLGRYSNKKYFCVYCKRLRTKLARHLAKQHFNEPEVAQALSLPKRSAERRKAWHNIAADGCFTYNSEVKMKGSGVLIPKRRPRKQKQATEYLPCEFCNMEIIYKNLWRHHKTCLAKPACVKSNAPVKNSRSLLPGNWHFSKPLKKGVRNKKKKKTKNIANGQSEASVTVDMQNTSSVDTQSDKCIDVPNSSSNIANGQSEASVTVDVQNTSSVDTQSDMCVDVPNSSANIANSQSEASVTVDVQNTGSVDTQSDMCVDVPNSSANIANSQSEASVTVDVQNTSSVDTQSDMCVDVPNSSATDEPDNNSLDKEHRIAKKCSGKSKKFVVKTPWSKEEREAVEHGLKKCFRSKTIPRMLECLEVIEEYPVLSRRSWRNVKDHVRTRLLSIQRAEQNENKEK